MATDSDLGSNNIHWGGNGSSGNAFSGMYNYCWVIKTNWGTNINHSGCKWMRQSQVPKVFRTNSEKVDSIFEVGDYVRNKETKFYINLFSANSARTDVRFTSPISTSFADTVYGYNNTVYSADQTFITVDCNVVYGFTFGGWRKNSASGTVISLNTSFSFFVTDSNMSGTTSMYALAI